MHHDKNKEARAMQFSLYSEYMTKYEKFANSAADY